MRVKWLIRVGIGCGLTVAVCGGSPEAEGQVEKVRRDSALGEAEPKEIVLNVSRQKLPDPLFKYRLLPLSTALNPGDAAQVYLRLDQQTSSERISVINNKAVEWSDLPLADFPQAEARKLVEDWSGRLRQLEFGTRRERCNWEYTIQEEKDNPFAILLPDAQAMRTWARLLALKARVEIAAGQTEQAIQTLETGIAFSRHVGSGPFHVNKLIGMYIVNLMLSQLDELIGQAGTPNLYWALTALPGSLFDLPDAAETELASIGRALTGQRLDEIDLTRPRPDTEWTTMLVNLHDRMIRMKVFAGLDADPAFLTIPDLATFRAMMLPQARDILKLRGLTATTDDQVFVKAIITLYRELADENFKLAYLPYPVALDRQGDVVQVIKAVATGPAAAFAQMLPAVQPLLLAEVRVSQKIAALRIVEALRLHAATHAGDLPDTLDQLKLVPIPDDPATGKSFGYRREGSAAIVTATTPPQPQLIYRITVRK